MKIIVLLIFSLIIHNTTAYAISRDKCELMNMLAEKKLGHPQTYKGKKYGFKDERALMRIYLRFYDKDIMLNKIALENAIQSDVEQCLKNKMMKQFSYDDIKNNSVRHLSLIHI